MFSILILLVPASFGVERAAALRPPTYEVRTAIEVSAPSEKVWNQVVAFAEIPAPEELLFRAGIAYPIRAGISAWRWRGAALHFLDGDICRAHRSVG
jgi:hypothetical protein